MRIALSLRKLGLTSDVLHGLGFGSMAAAIEHLAGRDSQLAAETLRQLAATQGHGMVAALLGSRP